ncbi:MAG: hypothetical protein NZ839_04385, partial [Endomicrobia bacterium]|nr:hypothetical protein [Endomicrobiia bacterium]
MKVVPVADVSSRGNTAAASDDTLGSVIFNPACLTSVETLSFLVSHFEYVENTRYESLILAKPLASFSIGIAFGYMYSEDIPRTLIDPNEMFGFSYSGTYGNNWLTSAVMFAKRKENFSFGSSVKFIQENLAGDKTQIVGLNLGILYSLRNKLSLGLVLDNISSGVENTKKSEDMPVIAKFGSKYKNGNYAVITEFEYNSNEYYHLKAGMQIKLLKIITINAGYDYHRSIDVLGW